MNKRLVDRLASTLGRIASSSGWERGRPTFAQCLSCVVGRLLLSLVFLVSALSSLANFQASLTRIGLSAIPLGKSGKMALLVASIVVELTSGLSILIGYRARLGALLASGFLVTSSLLQYNLWATPIDEERMLLLRNWAIIGGLLMIVTFGPGPWSLDRRRRAMQHLGDSNVLA